MTVPLPAPRDPASYRIAVVCLGNICRSPIADVVIEERLVTAGLSDVVRVESFGTGPWHAGEPMDGRSERVLREAGYDASRHRAQQITAEHAGRFDLVLGMDGANVTDLLDLLPDDADRVHRFRDLDPEGPGDVPDPYTGGPEGFTSTLATVERTADALVAALADLPLTDMPLVGVPAREPTA
ncbi:MAG TPA: low molecular weight protein-tyrosine-phosphatase [Nocardioides sp.]